MENNNYIKGTCRTNLDGYSKVVWPTVFCSVPEIGSYVQGFGTRFINTIEPAFGKCHQLKVVQITHTMYDGHPFIIVELNK